MKAFETLRNDRNERFQHEAREFVRANADKINRKLDYQERCAVQIDIMYEINQLKALVLIEYRGLKGLDTKAIDLVDMDTGREMSVNVVYLYNSYVLTDNSFIYLLVRQDGKKWMARTIQSLVDENIEQVNALNVYFAMQNPYKWNKAPIYAKIGLALDKLLDS